MPVLLLTSVQSPAHPRILQNTFRIMLRCHIGGRMKSKYSSSTAKVSSLCPNLRPFLPLFGPLSFTILDLSFSSITLSSHPGSVGDRWSVTFEHPDVHVVSHFRNTHWALHWSCQGLRQNAHPICKHLLALLIFLS
jgi:hypothetical protein